MKNQYFGDINDYRKYGLLRALQSGSGGTLLVAWMLTPNDGGPDGKFRSYLQQPEKWRGFDPELFDSLADAAQMTSVPHVSLIELVTVFTSLLRGPAGCGHDAERNLDYDPSSERVRLRALRVSNLTDGSRGSLVFKEVLRE